MEETAMSIDEVFDALMQWGKLGHGTSLHYGPAIHDDKIVYGWQCIIHPYSQGSVSYYGYQEPLPVGYHPTDAREAARQALRQAAQRWPEKVTQP